MSRTMLTVMFLTACGFAAESSAVTPRAPRGRTGPAASVSEQLPRLQRDLRTGRILSRQWQQQLQAGSRQATGRGAVSSGSTNLAGRRLGGHYSQDAWKRGGQRLNASDWKKGAPQKKLGSVNLKRMGGQYSQNAWKRGAGRFPAVNPAQPRSTATGAKAGGSGKLLKRAGAAGAVLGGAGLAAGAVSRSQQLDADLRAGRISLAEYNRAQATNAVNVAGGALAIKKMNPATLAMNAAIGTDPISLGVDAVGDLINGTSNAQKSLENIGKALEGHGRGIHKLVTNPGRWAQDTGKNIENAAKDVGNAIDNAAKDVGNFFTGIFGGK